MRLAIRKLLAICGLAIVLAIQSGPGSRAVAEVPQHMELDQEKIAAQGIRRIEGRHLDLYTDAPPSKEIDELPEIFAQAVPQWAERFSVDPARVADWKLNCFLMVDRQKFERANLIHPDLPAFLHGYQAGYQFWMNEQPSNYYQRHLMLHEGTHGFMNLVMGGTGPPWYSEGMAELLGCHKWAAGKLKLGHRIASREESPYWGRVKVIRDAVQGGIPLTLKEVLTIENRAFLKTESYAWAWAACAFFDGHPILHDEFQNLRLKVTDHSPAFADDFFAKFEPFWPRVQEQWQLFLDEMDYGYDVAAGGVVYSTEVKPITSEPALLQIQANRGWQSSGLRVESGQKLQIQCKGRFQVGADPEPWWCEPGGITIKYYRDIPLGTLLMAIKDEQAETIDGGRSTLLNYDAIGTATEKTLDRTGTIFFRINESPASLSDNEGSITIKVTSLE